MKYIFREAEDAGTGAFKGSQRGLLYVTMLNSGDAGPRITETYMHNAYSRLGRDGLPSSC